MRYFIRVNYKMYYGENMFESNNLIIDNIVIIGISTLFTKIYSRKIITKIEPP